MTGSENTNTISSITGVKVEEQPKTIEKDTAENERLIKKLDENTPHEITEDFTFKRPTDKKDLRKAIKIMDDFFVETNLSAN